jgi:thiamine-monophosphate kinase
MESAIREFELIADVFAPLADSKGALRLKDDVALLRARAGHDVVVTTDAIVEGIDFFANDPPDTIAKKALRVNLSDLAAKGAEPLGYLLTLMLPERINSAWLRKFARGLKADQKKFGVSLYGGDMSATRGPLSVSITAFGHVPRGRAILRGGAKPGDIVFVTGTIGDGGGGLAALKSKRGDHFLIRRYRLPEPRVAFGLRLRGVATAAIDVSDGLLADLGHIADVSKVHVVVELSRVPLSKSLQRAWGIHKAARVRAATAGDDYEIAFTAPPRSREKIVEAARKSRTAVTEIGYVKAGWGVVLLGAGGKPIRVKRKGWEHF